MRSLDKMEEPQRVNTWVNVKKWFHEQHTDMGDPQLVGCLDFIQGLLRYANRPSDYLGFRDLIGRTGCTYIALFNAPL